MEEPPTSEFSSHRLRAGLSIHDAADLLGISISTVEDYEYGRVAPRVVEMQAIKGCGFAVSGQRSEARAARLELFERPHENAETKSDAPKSRQSEFGQFLTPASVATFMANLFPAATGDIRLLDAGAGKGALASAFAGRWRDCGNKRLTIHGYELDDRILGDLRTSIQELCRLDGVDAEVFEGDFIEQAATMVRLGKGPRYTHAILNPPYKKIGVNSRHRAFLSMIGLETVNLYSGFVGLAIALMEPGGELVAIIPRSFCNGPYYQPFRRFMLARSAIRHIHLFEARDKAFGRDGVLQENVIIWLTCGGPQGDVTISTSADDRFLDYREVVHPFAHIVAPNDDDQFIHIPTGETDSSWNHHAFACTLDELGLSVSTGPVVDFRLRSELRANPAHDTVPLLYPGHFTAQGLKWPKAGFKKPNAIALTTRTTKWLMPTGFYAVVRRFSSKEERRRIVASVVEPDKLQGRFIGFENHLNVIHAGKGPLDEATARGIATYLNTSAVDQHFRRFNGHTQVNAADLRILRYPRREVLVALGEWAKLNALAPPEAIDARVSALA